MAKGEWTAEPHSWVVGASGYTGQALVARLAERAAGTAATVTAHLRPGRPHTSELRARFEGMGVRVVECPLLEAGPQALAGAFLDRPPTHLFLVHGTTRRRARLEGLDVDPYLTVDLGLTSLALEACRDLTPPPRVVLLSSQGAGPGARGAYLRARHLAEEAVRASGLPYTIARAPLITGPDRGEPRPLERLGGVALRALTRGLRAGGARATAARYAPLDAAELAEGLAHAGFNYTTLARVLEAEELRREAPLDRMAPIPATRRDDPRH
jgi:nucleoside-diphosphate-sugar epimerase